jgi:hypothetical protein
MGERLKLEGGVTTQFDLMPAPQAFIGLTYSEKRIDALADDVEREAFLQFRSELSDNKACVHPDMIWKDFDKLVARQTTWDFFDWPFFFLRYLYSYGCPS